MRINPVYFEKCCRMSLMLQTWASIQQATDLQKKLPMGTVTKRKPRIPDPPDPTTLRPATLPTLRPSDPSPMVKNTSISTVSPWISARWEYLKIRASLVGRVATFCTSVDSKLFIFPIQ